MLQGSKIIAEELEAITGLCGDRTVDFQLLCLESAEWIRDFVNANINDNPSLEIEPPAVPDIYKFASVAPPAQVDNAMLIDKPFRMTGLSENGSDTDLGIMGDTESINSVEDTHQPIAEALPMDVIDEDEGEEDAVKEQSTTMYTAPEAIFTLARSNATQSLTPLGTSEIQSTQQTFVDAETSHYDLHDSQQPEEPQRAGFVGTQTKHLNVVSTQETFVEETRQDIEMTQINEPSPLQMPVLQDILSVNPFPDQDIDISSKAEDHPPLSGLVSVKFARTERIQVEEKHNEDHPVSRVTFAALPPREPINTKRSIAPGSRQSERASFVESLRIEAVKRKTFEAKKSMDEMIMKNSDTVPDILNNLDNQSLLNERGGSVGSQSASRSTTEQSKTPTESKEEPQSDITTTSNDVSVYLSPKSTQRTLKSSSCQLSPELAVTKSLPKNRPRTQSPQKAPSPSKAIDEERQLKEKRLKDKFTSAGMQLHQKINQMNANNKNPAKSNVQKDEPSLGHFTSDDGEWIPTRDYSLAPKLSATAEGPQSSSPSKYKVQAISKSEARPPMLGPTSYYEAQPPLMLGTTSSPAKFKSPTKIPSLPQLRTPVKDPTLKIAVSSVPRLNFEAPKQAKTPNSPSRMAAAFNAAKARAAEGLRKAKELLSDSKDEHSVGALDRKDQLYPHVNAMELDEPKADDVPSSNDSLYPSQEMFDVVMKNADEKSPRSSPKCSPQTKRAMPPKKQQIMTSNEVRKSPRKIEPILKLERSQEFSTYGQAPKMATRMASRQAAAQKTKTIMRVATASQREMERKNAALGPSSQARRGSSEEPTRPDSAASNGSDRPCTYKAGNKVIKSLTAASNAKKRINLQDPPEEKSITALKRNFPPESSVEDLGKPPSTDVVNRFVQQDAKRRKTQDIIEQIPLPPPNNPIAVPKKVSISGKPMRTSGIKKHDTSKMPFFNKIAGSNKFRVQGGSSKVPHVEGITFSTETIKFAGEAPPFPPSENIELPEIDSDYSDSEDEPKEKPVLPSWANSPELRAALRQQQKRDPDEIFGPIGPLQMDEIFKNKNQAAKFRPRSSSANWNGQDKLTSQEVEEYALKMGYR
ncbi:Inner centromere protein-related protein pic1 [Neolecta irregularis DAH-3]|uniref:Inner centromere protein-related protein pic1 n=1 Tax=Neolecta irregularis (strain DAH-3) TaxID=1198029 RepID=A0A1U7LMV4_NEOID|nr:Inner centromere protein-related protein pic1 [Neolecta irregularis DAH-3]|eukprot:OLL23985.1 Inner centromere protein-related protein pic1 [Neolecta irregularis DAH-3]